MDLGLFNQRITFLSQGPGQDDHGQPNGVWAPIVTQPTMWARSAGVSARDIAAGGVHQATVDVKWIVRHRADVQPTWRVRWRGEDYAIVGDPGPVSGGAEWMEIRGRKVVTP